MGIVVSESFVQDLYRDTTIKLFVLGKIYLTHPADADPPYYFVMSKTIAGAQHPFWFDNGACHMTSRRFLQKSVCIFGRRQKFFNVGSESSVRFAGAVEKSIAFDGIKFHDRVK